MQNFSIWVFGHKNDLSRGSGLYVGKVGVTYSHHFLLPPDGTEFRFVPGEYTVEIFAKVVGEQKTFTLFETKLQLLDNESKSMESSQTGVYFDWGPETSSYHSHIENG